MAGQRLQRHVWLPAVNLDPKVDASPTLPTAKPGSR